MSGTSKEVRKRYYYKHRERILEANKWTDIRRLYGLSKEEYLDLMKKQKGLCSICRDPLVLQPRKYGLDHCHKTGKIRGFLCVKCNSGLGMFRDSVEILENAIEYLRSQI